MHVFNRFLAVLLILCGSSGLWAAPAKAEDAKAPPLLITELAPLTTPAPGTTGGSGEFIFIELYNPTDKPIDLTGYKVHYYYDPNKLWDDSKANKWDLVKDTFSTDIIVAPKAVKVVWLKKEVSHALPLKDFVENFGMTEKQLSGDKVIVLKNKGDAGLHPSAKRAVGIVSPKGELIVGASYNDEKADVKMNETITYTYPKDGSNIMLKLGVNQKATPGSLVNGQVPETAAAKPAEGKVTFADMAGHWAKEDVELLASKQIVNGISDNKFGPDDKITRAQFATLLVRSLGITSSNAGGKAIAFNDVKASDWYAEAVTLASRAGLINGYEDQTFRPDRNITREETAIMIARAIEFSGIKVSDAKKAEIDKFIKETKQVTSTEATRALAASAMKRMLEAVQLLK